MEFDCTFDVPLPPPQAWRLLMDIERIAPCMPGATLTERVDARTYKGKMSVRLGPVTLGFAGTATFEEIDAAAETARVKAVGTDAKGRGGATAVARFSLTPGDAGTRVLIRTSLTLSGFVAQYGRGAGMIQEVAAQLIGQFATNLQALIEAERPADLPVTATAGSAPPPPSSAAAKPISALRLLFGTLWIVIRRRFGARL